MTPLCFIDTETTGVHPERQAWEIAAIRRDNEGQKRLHLLVEVDLSNADPFGLKIGGFYQRHPLGQYLSFPRTLGMRAPSEPDHLTGEGWHYVSRPVAARLVASWTHGAHLVGAVPNFDSEVLAALLRFYELTPSWHYHLIDVEAMAVGYLHGRYAEAPGGGLSGAVADLPWKSDELSRACGVLPPADNERHTALGDAEWAMRWYDAITGAKA